MERILVTEELENLIFQFSHFIFFDARKCYIERCLISSWKWYNLPKISNILSILDRRFGLERLTFEFLNVFLLFLTPYNYYLKMFSNHFSNSETQIAEPIFVFFYTDDLDMWKYLKAINQGKINSVCIFRYDWIVSKYFRS